HPGNVASSFGNYTNSKLIRFAYRTLSWALITPEKGADTLNWLIAEEPGTTWEPGRYYYKRKPAKTSPRAADPDLAAQLWDRSAAMMSVAG
ncbi:hypothetical protein ACFTXB_14865, partial [Streptomyces sp. NPDC057074]